MVSYAANAANFGDLSRESFTNGLVFPGDGSGGGVEVVDSTMSLVGEMLEIGTSTTPMLRFICISNSPTYYHNKNQLVIYKIPYTKTKRNVSLDKPIKMQR